MIGLVLGLGVGLAWVRGTSGNGYVHMIFTGAFICICTHVAQLRTRKHTLAHTSSHTHLHLHTVAHTHSRTPVSARALIVTHSPHPHPTLTHPTFTYVPTFTHAAQLTRSSVTRSRLQMCLRNRVTAVRASPMRVRMAVANVVRVLSVRDMHADSFVFEKVQTAC